MEPIPIVLQPLNCHSKHSAEILKYNNSLFLVSILFWVYLCFTFRVSFNEKQILKHAACNYKMHILISKKCVHRSKRKKINMKINQTKFNTQAIMNFDSLLYIIKNSLVHLTCISLKENFSIWTHRRKLKCQGFFFFPKKMQRYLY